MAVAYSKHKDRAPLETVERIRSMLDRIGLATSVTWTGHQYGRAHSNRVAVEGTSFASNGKGTDEEYALASGYAELMERLQNKMVGRRTHVARAYERQGFYDFPDERLTSAEEVVRRRDPIIDGWLGDLGLAGEEEGLEFLSYISSADYHRTDGMLAEVPFVDDAGEPRWLPVRLVQRMCGTNGMAAGNTLEECLVQGLSEVFERYVRRKIICDQLTPPEIDREELERQGASELVARIEEDGRYRVHVLDGSLGLGYPVIVTVFVDRFRGTFGVSCGAHPSMAVAIERTLTEAFQGRDVYHFSCVNDVAVPSVTTDPANLLSTIADGTGTYPPSLLGATPSWVQARWPEADGLSNRELLRRMVALLRRDGYRLFARDCSFLGFPTCQVVVPGMSETGFGSAVDLEALRGEDLVRSSLSHFPDLSEDELTAIFRYEERILARPLPETFGRPFTGIMMQAPRMYGFLHLVRGEHAAAARAFLRQADEVELPGRLYWQILARYAAWREQGMTHDEAIRLVERLYLPAFSRRAMADTAPGPDMLGRIFPRMTCYDCGRCELAARGGCKATADAEVTERLDKAMAASGLTQEAIARLMAESNSEKRRETAKEL